MNRTKTVVDYVAATMLLLTLIWFYPLVAIAIKLSSEGPVLFRQLRVGKDKAVFECIKFRTMTIDTPNVSTHEIRGDYVTRLGRFLRRTKIDELPQILNILRGEMSLIGPRPCLTTQDTIIAEREKRNIFCVKPGIAGLAQVYGVDMSTPVKLSRYDSIYIKNWSLKLDLQIALSMLGGKGFGDRVRKFTH